MNTFISVFTNHTIVDKIRSYLPICPQNSYLLPNTYFIRGGILRYITVCEFFIYMAFYFGMEKCLYYYHKSDIINVLKKKNIINAMVENTDYCLLPIAYNFFNMTYSCTYKRNIFANEEALFSTIKHNDITWLRYLHDTLHIRYKKTNIYNTYENHLLNFAIMNGNLDIVKYICYKYNIFGNIQLAIHNEICSVLESAIDEAIKYDNLTCAYFLIDYYKIKRKKISKVRISSSLKDKLSVKAKNIHNKLFSYSHSNSFNNFSSYIDWWLIEYNINKINDPVITSYIETIKNNDTMNDFNKGYVITIYLSKLCYQVHNDNDNLIYVYLDDDTGYYTSKKKVFEHIIRELYVKPLTIIQDKNIELYKEYHHLHGLLR